MVDNNRINIKATKFGKRREVDTKEEDTQTSNGGNEIRRAPQRHDQYRNQQFHLRNNLNQSRENEKHEQKQEEGRAEEENKESEKVPVHKPQTSAERQLGKGTEEDKNNILICKRCGKVGHKSEDCYRPSVCPRCNKEGHVARSCPEIMPWECIAPFCGLAAHELGFHIIQDDDSGDSAKESTNLAVITIKEGEVTARQVKGEFKAQAAQNSTWRWYAKKYR
jgi:rubrerythrin